MQERSDHSLMREDEISGYPGNDKIRVAIETVEVPAREEHIRDALRACCRARVYGGFAGAEEPPVLDAWLADLSASANGTASAS